MSKTFNFQLIQYRKPAWCLTCGALAKLGCSVHSIIDVTGNTIKNFESLLKLRDELKKMRDQGQTKLALAIEKRKEVQAHLNQVSQCLNLVLHEVNQQEEENNIILVEMISLLE
jgi:small nuclear ribonucleoprotein (snRNP)-like protein